MKQWIVEVVISTYGIEHTYGYQVDEPLGVLKHEYTRYHMVSSSVLRDELLSITIRPNKDYTGQPLLNHILPTYP